MTTEEIAGVIETASKYGEPEYDTEVITLESGDGSFRIRTQDLEDTDADWPGPVFCVSYFGQLNGRELLEVRREPDDYTVGYSTVVEADGPALFALIYA